MLAVAGEKQRTVKIDIVGDAGEEPGGSHAQRGANHTTDQQLEPGFTRLLAQMKCLSECAKATTIHSRR